jgi:hypothetical protein
MFDLAQANLYVGGFAVENQRLASSARTESESPGVATSTVATHVFRPNHQPMTTITHGRGTIQAKKFIMKNSSALLLVAFLLVLSSLARTGRTGASSNVTAHPIQPTFFGMHINRLTTPWPQVPFGSLRMLADLTTWLHLEGEGRNRYDWRTLDAWLDAARAHNVDVMYTFSRTPVWAARNARATCGPNRGEADCSPPSDLTIAAPCQGPLLGTTTTDCFFKEFVTSLLNHVCNGKAPNKSCRIVAFSCWNEPNLDAFWIGTYAESARMCSDMVQTVKDQCKDCATLTPDVSAATSGDTKANGDSRSYDEWFKNFLITYRRYGNYPDAGAFHPYAARTHGIVPAPFPETFAGSGCPHEGRSPVCPDTLLGKIDTMRSLMNQNGMAGRPLWATEGGWGTNGEMPDPDVQAAYVSRWLILQASAGVQRAYWYMWDSSTNPQGWGSMWDAANGTDKAGIAYGQIYDWLVGATFTKPCSADHDVWICHLSWPGGKQGQIVWNASRSYDTRTSWKYTVGTQFTQLRDLDGNRSTITGGSIAIGSKPILLENRVSAASEIGKVCSGDGITGFDLPACLESNTTNQF